MPIAEAKAKGAYYTPTEASQTLVRWVVRNAEDRLLDPACGDGQFLSHHPRAVGVESDHVAAIAASHRAKGSIVHVGDFFSWAEQTSQRFDCAAGNPPFIRYQRFSGDVRRRALLQCERMGVRLTALTSSWAPFLVVSASLLKMGGRMAFVVPAEIGHAPYAAPVVSFLAHSFGHVQFVAIRDSMFERLNQDVWLLYAADYGRSTDRLSFTAWDTFKSTARPPRAHAAINLEEWQQCSKRLRPFLLPAEIRSLYEELSRAKGCYRLGEVARVGIGYVTGANDFFHFRPSQAKTARIPESFLVPAVRNGRMLPPDVVTKETLRDWIARDEPCLLLRLESAASLPATVQRYLDSKAGQEARQAYKCRCRDPWYVVPDVSIPDGFLTYMSGAEPLLVINSADCASTNSLHVIRMRRGQSISDVKRVWQHPLTRLSVELEGHPLGGGMLKLEPTEASRILLPPPDLALPAEARSRLLDGRSIMRRWRHYA